jgi:hypothetical protein
MVWRLQSVRSCLRRLTAALSVFDRKVFLMTTAPRPPAFRILMKCWRKRKAVSLGEVLPEGVGVDDVRGLDAVEEAQLVDVVDDLAEVVAALDAVFDLPEDLGNLVLDGVGAGRLGLEGLEVGEELPVHEGDEVVAGQGPVVVDPTIRSFRCGPGGPAIGLIQNEGVALAVQSGLGGLVLLEAVQIFEKEEPRGLLGVVQLAGATRVLPEDIVDILEGLLEHGVESPITNGTPYS